VCIQLLLKVCAKSWFFLKHNWHVYLRNKLFFQECMEGDSRPLTGDCDWYKLCLNGEYTARKCPMSIWQKQLYNPATKNCTDDVRLSVDGKCQSYKTCLLIESVSMNRKWTEVSCGAGKHFDQKSQKCIDAEASICGEYFPSFCLKGCDFEVYHNMF